MNNNEIIKHCTVIEVVSCENQKHWYKDLIGKQLVAFGYDDVEEQVAVCHESNDEHTTSTIPLEHCKLVQGNLKNLIKI